ncbi:MAG: hypothetical protein HKN43_06730 [Rhodothermales bacterium]|nr:hypothetical protein [Rhodothermales bacterium]
MKSILLKKGWAGKTISRAETIERFNPIIKKHIVLNRFYDAAIRDLDHDEHTKQFTLDQRTARADVGKLCETVFSCGGVAYSGTDLDPEAVSSGSSLEDVMFNLFDLETDLQDAISEEESIEHQMRSRAILGVVKTHSAERYKYLSNATRKLNRPD